MSDRQKKAVSYHHSRYNCTQAVLCVFADELNMEPQDLFRAAEAFGFGMGVMSTCGAVSAMALAVGFLESDGNMEEPKTKRTCYRAMKKLIGGFEEKNGTIICRELKGVDTGRVIRTCDGCIEDAVELLEEYLSEKKEAKSNKG